MRLRESAKNPTTDTNRYRNSQSVAARMGELRSEVKIQSKLHVALVARGSKTYECTEQTVKDRVPRLPRGIVRRLENMNNPTAPPVPMLSLRQFEICAGTTCPSRKRTVTVKAHAPSLRDYWRWDRKGKRIKTWPRRHGRGELYEATRFRAPPLHGNVGERREFASM